MIDTTFNVVVVFPSGHVFSKGKLTEKEARELCCRRWRKYEASDRNNIDDYCIGYHPDSDDTRGKMLHSVRGHHLPVWCNVRQLG
tara:strand:- start:915 stop:1169 length:255 start_codon:yes stop_codon:yes gene_type:complete